MKRIFYKLASVGAILTALMVLTFNSKPTYSCWKPCNQPRDCSWDLPPGQILCWSCPDTDICGHVSGFVCCYDSGDED